MPVTVLTTAQWQARAAAHRAAVAMYTDAWRERRARGAVHPVYDFLFQYYHYSPAKLEAWHPDPLEALEDSPEARALFGAPRYVASNHLIHRRPITPPIKGSELLIGEPIKGSELLIGNPIKGSELLIGDPIKGSELLIGDPIKGSELLIGERTRMQEALQLLRATQERPANFGCFGMHEWAMVYRGTEVRHQATAPLRLSQAEVDAFVESRPVACSHFDAFRFFSPSARPLNRLPLAWESRYDHEQPGCIHANMDLYRWAYASMPWIGSDLLAECFRLAVALRELDMQAAPYDLAAFGVVPVCIETAAGRDEYQTRQRALSARAGELRARLIDRISVALGAPVESPV